MTEADSVTIEQLASTAPVTFSESIVKEEIPATIRSQHVRQQARLPSVQGVKLWLLVAVLMVGLLLSSLEQLIVGTALTNITSELGDFSASSWVVTAYLMAYNSFLVLFARASDIYGRRSTYLVAIVIFTIASLACGLAQTMIQLIVFRFFQGIGGAGLFTLSLSVATEIPGKARFVIQILIPSAFGLAAAAAPVVGGAIVSRTTWRWVFLLNVPPGVILIGATLCAFPRNTVPLKNDFSSLSRLDWPGTSILVATVILLGYSLQEGSTGSVWKTARILVPAVLQIFGWVGFFLWERYLTVKDTVMLPIWPTRLFTGRVIGCAMLCGLFCGAPMYSIYIYEPQRLEIVGGLSALDSGLHFLVVPILAFFATVLFALSTQALGLGLLSRLSLISGIPASFYGFSVLVGMGFGLAVSALSFVVRGEVGHLDHSVSMAALSSLRSLGGSVGVSIGRIVLQAGLLRSLTGLLTPEQEALVNDDPEYIARPDKAAFSSIQLLDIRKAFDERFNIINKVNTGLILAALVVAVFCYRQHPVSIQEMDERENKEKQQLDEMMTKTFPSKEVSSNEKIV